VKPGPVIIMAMLVFLGLWLVWLRPPPMGDVVLRDGARTTQIRIGQSKGIVEVVDGPSETAQPTYRVIWQDGHESEVITRDRLEPMVSPRVLDRLSTGQTNFFFRLFNITSWASMVWITIGLGGQAVFSCRFIVQWIVSEQQRRSVVPEAFWWISLVGAVSLFTYFVWRQDVVGVLGQSTGVVIYARNLRLIHKQRRRDARGAEPTVSTG